jgi:hypothetical protein
MEAHWGPEWEQRGYAAAGHRGTGAAGSGPVVRDPAAATQCDRHAAHGPCVQPDHHGQPDALPPHARATTRSGCRAPTTPASPPRSSSSASCRTRASAASRARRPGPQELRRAGVGMEGKERATPSPRRCAAWATAWTGAANTSRWTTSCPRGDRNLRAAVRAGPDLPRQAPGQLGPGAQDRRERPGGGKRRGRRLPVAHPLPVRRRPADGRRRLQRPDRGHHPARDHAGRRGGDGAPRGRTLHPPDRQAGAPAAVRPDGSR